MIKNWNEKTISEFYARSLVDHEYYCENCLFIQTDKKTLIPFKFNSIQRKLDKRVQEIQKKDGFVRAVVLKARREGLSTYITSRAFKDLHLIPYSRTATISMDIPSTNFIFGMSKIYYNNLPKEIQPSLKYSNRKELMMDSFLGKEMGSGIELYTAGTDSGRGQAYTFMHGSEVAFYKDTLLISSIMQTIKDIPGTEIWLESTPNGKGGLFYNYYMDAKAGNSEWHPIFYSWFDFDEYYLPFRNKQEEEEFMESVLNHRNIDKYGQEDVERELYKLSWEQLNWRRWYIRNKCNNHPYLKPLDLFKQEYPSNDVECFLTSSSTVFDMNTCLTNEEKCTPPEFQGYLGWVDEKKNSVKLIPDGNGSLKVYEYPDTEPYVNRYCAGVDVSEGVVGGDFTAVYVMDRLTRRTVASWHGIKDSDLIANELLKLARFYNNDVYYCIERNNDGKVVLSGLKDTYKKLYISRSLDKRTQKINKEKLGFETTSASKPIIIANLNKQIREGSFQCREKEFWQESETFVHHEKTIYGKGGGMSALNKGKSGAGDRCFDDRVMAMAFTLEADRDLGVPRKSYSALPKWAKKLLDSRNQTKSWMSA